jgi:hypothetical protein
MATIPEWANDRRWGDVTGALVRFGKFPDEGVARGRVVLTFEPDGRHDLIWLYQLRDEVSNMWDVKSRDHEEQGIREALHHEWDVSAGRILRLPASITGGVRAYLWDIEVPLNYLPDGVNTEGGRENWLLPCRADWQNRTGVRGLPYSREMRDKRPEHFIQAIQPRGVHRQAALVQANNQLWEPGDVTLPALVLISFERGSDVMSTLHDLAAEAAALKSRRRPRDRDEQWVGDALRDEEAFYHRRRRLPRSFTGGRVVYLADLWMPRRYLRNGVLGRVREFPVLAEPGDEGGLELLPYWDPHAFDPPALDVLPADD